MKILLKFVLTLLSVLMIVATVTAEEATDEKVVIYFQDGSKVLLPAEVANDPEKLSAYCDSYFPGRAYTRDENAASFNFDSVISESWVVSRYGAGSRAMSVRLVKLGLYTSVIATTQGEELTVPTHELTIRGFNDVKHHVAVVSAPRSGEASLRETASSKGKLVETCKTGRVVAVLEYTNASLTKILYDGAEGYIRTDCLIFNDGSQAPLGTGTLHVKNVTDGKESVTLRATASTSTAKVTALATGTVVTVHEKQGKWYAVESDGWYGYVQEQYLNLIEE